MDSATTRPGARLPLGAPALGLAVVACWWLGWDAVRDVDPATGTAGCAVLVAATRAVGRRLGS
jgi:hypothetical protein